MSLYLLLNVSDECWDEKMKTNEEIAEGLKYIAQNSVRKSNNVREYLRIVAGNIERYDGNFWNYYDSENTKLSEKIFPKKYFLQT